MFISFKVHWGSGHWPVKKIFEGDRKSANGVNISISVPKVSGGSASFCCKSKGLDDYICPKVTKSKTRPSAVHPPKETSEIKDFKVECKDLEARGKIDSTDSSFLKGFPQRKGSSRTNATKQGHVLHKGNVLVIYEPTESGITKDSGETQTDLEEEDETTTSLIEEPESDSKCEDLQLKATSSEGKIEGPDAKFTPPETKGVITTDPGAKRNTPICSKGLDMEAHDKTGLQSSQVEDTSANNFVSAQESPCAEPESKGLEVTDNISTRPKSPHKVTRRASKPKYGQSKGVSAAGDSSSGKGGKAKKSAEEAEVSDVPGLSEKVFKLPAGKRCNF